MEAPEMKDYLTNSLCRICAEKRSKLIPIFEIKLLALKIHKCLPIQVAANDELPVNICEMCLVKVDESYLLYESCYYADQKLKNIWKTLLEQSVTKPSIIEAVESQASTIPDRHDENDFLLSSSNTKSVNLSEGYVSNVIKKVPINVILIGDSLTLEEGLQNEDFQCVNEPNDVLISSDVIINMTGSEFSSLNALEPGQEQELCTNDSNKGIEGSSEVNIVPNLKEKDQQEKRTGIYQCNHCPQQFGNISSLNNHESTHLQEKPYLCDTCGKSFKHAQNLKSHAKIHSSHRKKYMCKVCNKTFFTNFFLQEHMNTHTGETPYKCHICGKEFREKVHLRQHKWTHSAEKFLCPICGNHFNRKGNMTEHVKKYHSSNEVKTKKTEGKKSSDLKFSCSICSKCFSSQSILRNHHKRHIKNHQLYFCSLCGKEFRHSGSLTYHRRTAHTGEKPFQCTYCEERFCLRSVQRIHERKKHTFEHPYKCAFCTRTFYNSSSLKNHSYVHMKEKMFECDVCGKKFSRNSNLYVHKKIHSNDRQYTCDECGKSYIQKHDMVKHKKVHDPKSKPFYCKYCANSFSHKKDFSRHAICHYDYIRKGNSEIGTAEKILETVAGDLEQNSSKTLFDAERLILESSDDFVE